MDPYQRRNRRAGYKGLLSAAAMVLLATASAAAPPDRVAAQGVAAQDFADTDVAIAPAVADELAEAGVTDFWVDFEDRADLSGAYEIDDWAERGRYVHDRLTHVADASQAGYRAALAARGVAYEPFWIANTILVQGGDRGAVDAALTQAGVARIRADEPLALPPVEPEPDGDAGTQAVEWGIADIRADQVWDELGVRGEGIVVGSIDTGVQYDHPALVGQYRGNLGDGMFDHHYQWWDPSQVCPSPEPCDNNNHGTHTVGTMVGDDGGSNQIGVAPAAQWMAAKGCESRTCSGEALLSSGQFMLAPTNLAGESPRPELRPHIVNNSWGDDGGQDWYDATVESWVAAGMFPVFANGNDGPGCGTAGSPADGPDAYAVGAYRGDHQIASFSSRGPGRDEEIRPHIAAPGQAIRSAVVGGYGNLSGTSMAAPHVAGTVALLWSASELAGEVALTREALDLTAVDTEDLSCGGTPGNNNAYGQGRLDAHAATLEVGVDTGISGTVRDAGTGEPLAGVTVGGPDIRERTTAADGGYLVRLRPGTYTLEFSRFGYHTQTLPDLVVTDDGLLARDVDLEPAPSGAITGTVTDAISGHPIPAVTVEVLDVPAVLRATTGDDGGYTIPDVPVGTYQIRATAATSDVTPVWLPATVEVEATESGGSGDVALEPIGGIERMSVSGAGVRSQLGTTHGEEMSADGRYIRFWAPEASGLVEDPLLPESRSRYVHDRATRTTEAVLTREYPTWRDACGNQPGSLVGHNCHEWVPVAGPAPDPDSEFRYLGFVSQSPDLVDQDFGTHCRDGLATCPQVYLHDRVTGQTEAVSVDGDGALPGGGLLDGEIAGTSALQDVKVTPDGRYVLFAGTQPALADGVEFAGRQLFLRDMVTGETELVSVNSAGQPAGAGVLAPQSPGNPSWAVTPDGRYVLFESLSSNLVDGELWECPPPGFVVCRHVFLHDRETGETHWVSHLPPDELPAGHVVGGHHAVTSDDGRYVAYEGSWELLTGMTRRYAYVYDVATGETERFSDFPVPGGTGVFATRDPRISADGRYVTVTADRAFQSEPRRADDQVTGTWVIDRETGAAERLVEPYDRQGWRPGFAHYHRGLTPDGRFVLVANHAGASADAGQLLPGDEDAQQVYLVDRAHDPAAPQSRFTVWDLSVAPGEPLTGEPVEVSARVRNAGDAAGEYDVHLRVDRRHEATATVSLAPGETTEVSWTVARDAPGDYEIRVGHLARQLRVGDRAPVLDLDAERLDLTLDQGETRTAPLTVANQGLDQPLTWEVTEAPGGQQPPAPGTVITHSASMDIVEGNFDGCRIGPATRANQYLRTFELGEFGLAAGFGVTEVTFGVESLTLPPEWNGDTAPITVNVYTLAGELRYANLTRIGTATVDLPEQELTLVTVPITAGAPAGSTLVVEVVAPRINAGLFTGWFYPGTNDLGESAPSYLASAHCEVHDPVAYPSIGLDDVHLVMTVAGDPDSCALPGWLAVEPAGGSVDAGAAQEVAVTVDTSGLAPGHHAAQLCLASGDPARPLVGVPVTVEVTGTPCDETISGVHRGPLTVADGVTCLADDARVLGPVTVREGAGLVATGATVTGPVMATGAAVLELRDSDRTGPVTVQGVTDRVVIAGNRILGPVQLTDNSTGETPVVVSGNRIVGPLACVGNEPPPVDNGSPNTVIGPRTGQCARM